MAIASTMKEIEAAVLSPTEKSDILHTLLISTQSGLRVVKEQLLGSVSDLVKERQIDGRALRKESRSRFGADQSHVEIYEITWAPRTRTWRSPLRHSLQSIPFSSSTHCHLKNHTDINDT